MNAKFNNALYLLDKGEYDKGEICLRDAMDECDRKWSLSR